MGQQGYEQQVMSGVERIAPDHGWDCRRRVVSNLRFPGASDARVPMGLVGRSSVVARIAGMGVSPRAGIVHRLDLRLPPTGRWELITVHDLAPLRFSDEGSLPPWFADAARRGVGCIAPSAWAAAEIRETLGLARVWTVHNGFDTDFRAGACDPRSTLQELGVTTPVVLNAGGASERKNLRSLAAAWPEVHARTGAVLILTGPEHPVRTRLFHGMPGTRLLGRVPVEVLAGLMAGASLLVVPSIYEGFGMQVLEAMSAGCPVVCSNRSALSEVAGGAACLVEPDAVSLGRGMLSVLENPEVGQRMRAAGHVRVTDFSWERSATAHLAVYEEVFAMLTSR